MECARLSETETLNTAVSEAVSLRAALSDKVKEAGALSVKEFLFVAEALSFNVMLSVRVPNARDLVTELLRLSVGEAEGVADATCDLDAVFDVVRDRSAVSDTLDVEVNVNADVSNCVIE